MQASRPPLGHVDRKWAVWTRSGPCGPEGLLCSRPVRIPCQACASPPLQSPPCLAPNSSLLPEFGSVGLGWDQLFAASQVMLMVQGTHFENTLLQGKFLGTYWNTQLVPQGRRWALCPPPPPSEFLGVLKGILVETPLGSLSWAPPGAASAWDAVVSGEADCGPFLEGWSGASHTGSGSGLSDRKSYRRGRGRVRVVLLPVVCLPRLLPAAEGPLASFQS